MGAYEYQTDSEPALAGNLAKKQGSDQLAEEKFSEPPLPEQFVLNQNYPNPFNPSTIISFEIPEACDVQFYVYNSLGQEVKQIMSGFYAAGRYSVIWNATDKWEQPVRNGMYLALLRAGEFTKTIKMTLIR